MSERVTELAAFERGVEAGRAEAARSCAGCVALREALTALVSYTEACEGVLNARPAGQVLAARAALAQSQPDGTP